jgi:cation diffusion facilitator family transporter
VLKLGGGLATGSLGLVSAGIESSGDVIAAALTFFAIRLGARPADADHPYGHRRVENLAALGEALILGVGGVIVTVEAIMVLTVHRGESLEARWYVFAVIGAALAVDATRIGASLAAARRYVSAAFRSNAYHFAGDMAGTLVVLVGLILVAAGVKRGDAIAALVVAGIIFAAVVRLVTENASALMDRAPVGARRVAAEALRRLEPQVELRRLRLRESAGRVFADVTVGVPPATAVVESHVTADRVEAAVQRALPGSDVVVHVEPRERNLDLRQRVLAAALAEPLIVEAHNITVFSHGDRTAVSLHLKFPAEVPLIRAHEVAERVEARIRASEGAELVQTHLEPLEAPVAAVDASGEDAAYRRQAIEHLVRARLGRPPRDLHLFDTPSGRVLFLDVETASASLAVAHAAASELEEALRRAHPDLVEVVVHTEP